MTTSTDITKVLVMRLKKKDPTALDYLYEHYSAALMGIIERTLGSKAEAEETLHDVFIKIWKQIDQFDRSKGTLFTWMYRIARNQAIDKLRSRKFQESQKSTELDSYVNMWQASPGNEDYIGLKEVITNLESGCQQLIQLNFFMGYSHAEISKNEDMPLGSVKTKIRNCLKKIRSLLSQDFG